MRYPSTRRGDVVDTLHGHQIADPYRWLEDPDSAETRAWVNAQREFTEDILATYPERAWFQRTAAAFASRPSAGALGRHGGWYTVSRHDGIQQQPTVYCARSLDELLAGGRVLFDPSSWSPDGTTSLQFFSISRDGRYVCASISEAGSDWQHFRIFDMATGQRVDDPGLVTKFSMCSWLPDNESFLYVKREIDRAEGTNTQELPLGHLAIHRVGDDPSKDQIVWENPGDPMLFTDVSPSTDGRWLVATQSWGTEPTCSLWVYRLELVEGHSVVGERYPIIPERTAQWSALDVIDDELILYTDAEAPNARIVGIPVADPTTIRTIVAESSSVLENAAITRQGLIVSHLVDVTPTLTRYCLAGEALGSIDLTAGSVIGLSADLEHDDFLLTTSSVTQRSATYVGSLASDKLTPLDFVPSTSSGNILSGSGSGNIPGSGNARSGSGSGNALSGPGSGNARSGSGSGNALVEPGSADTLAEPVEAPEPFDKLRDRCDEAALRGHSGVGDPFDELREQPELGESADIALPRITQQRRRAVSKDGTEVPYFLIAREGHDFSVPTPTLVYGYGGFTVPVLANYSLGFATWLAAGGVLAIGNIRGGSEFGTPWYEGGRLDAKQHCFDDICAIGEHLQATGVAGKNHLIVHGRSNGGLLAGAALVQRPDLWQVSLPVVGVLDLVRFHLFTGGKAWVSDYGNPDDPHDFEVELGYSPVHNVVEGAHYPATLVATGDHDDRVVPLHSFKFAATLQHAQAGGAPTLIRIEEATGHGMGKPVAKQAEEWSDLLAFAAHHTGLIPDDGPAA